MQLRNSRCPVGLPYSKHIMVDPIVLFEAANKMITVRDIREGLRHNQFLMHYQPKVSLITGRLGGAEALIRWVKPDGSMRQPSEFIPLAERSPLIKKITSHMFPRLITDMLTQSDMEPVPISFNVSARDFEDMVFARQILETVKKHRMEPEAIEVEITETEALSGGDHLMNNMSILCDAGIGLSMDDYGTGYSSIDTLSKWPFTTIKLDQGIIGRMLESDKNATIVRSSIRLGHELKINVVAEGVETEEQYQFLLEAGCKMVQGYLISKPLPLDHFVAFRNQESLWSSFPIGLVHMAIIDHVQWRRQIVSYVIKHANLPPDSPSRQSPGYPALSCLECALGQWYFGEGQIYSNHAAFLALDVPHRALHEVGSHLVGRVKAGAQLDEMIPLLKDLAGCSIAVLSLLEALEDFGLVDMYGAH
jgi:EAL domain-containing protein (putative c-di-GMP-specific phosphodiesterase class I)